MAAASASANIGTSPFRPDYMDRIQRELNPMMRRVLLKWLNRAVPYFGLADCVYFQAVYYIDAFLSKHSVPMTRFQLLGVCAISLAAKDRVSRYNNPNIKVNREGTNPALEQSCVPLYSELAEVTDDTYTETEVEKGVISLSHEIKSSDIRPLTMFDYFYSTFHSLIEPQDFDAAVELLKEYVMDPGMESIKYPQELVALSVIKVILPNFNMPVGARNAAAKFAPSESSACETSIRNACYALQMNSDAPAARK